MSKSFCLVLAVWGDLYKDESVNVIVDSIRKNSPNLKEVILLTDRLRPNISSLITQKIFPDFYHRPDFFGLGYRVKISVFDQEVLPPNSVCVYLDLDTMVVGDVGKIADLVKQPSDVYMLPPGSVISFSPIRRLLFRLTNGKHFATGNSSVLAYHSKSKNNISDIFKRHFNVQDKGRYMNIDDVFISWAGQPFLRGMPTNLAVSFRREFLSHLMPLLLLKKISPFRQARHNGLVAVTFNGTSYKPHELLKLSDGEKIQDSKGRFGFWSDVYIGPLRHKILDYCQKIVNASK